MFKIKYAKQDRFKDLLKLVKVKFPKYLMNLKRKKKKNNKLGHSAYSQSRIRLESG